MTTSFNYDGKPGYIYSAADDTWYELSGKTDTSGTFEWSGPHTFLSSIDIDDHVVARKGINNFLNPSSRDSEIPSPIDGTVIFLRQDPSGNSVNEIQYYNNSEWLAIASQTLLDELEIKGIMGLLGP